jgi:hypothetical protein
MTTCTAAVLLTITVVVDRYRTGTMMSLVQEHRKIMVLLGQKCENTTGGNPMQKIMVPMP